MGTEAGGALIIDLQNIGIQSEFERQRNECCWFYRPARGATLNFRRLL